MPILVATDEVEPRLWGESLNVSSMAVLSPRTTSSIDSLIRQPAKRRGLYAGRSLWGDAMDLVAVRCINR